jgi:hypothetical protein
VCVCVCAGYFRIDACICILNTSPQVEAKTGIYVLVEVYVLLE